MARIGKQIAHFREIDPKSIRACFSEDLTYRYTLRLNYHASLLRPAGSDCITVILKNPSSADEQKADATIRKVETYVYKHFPRAGSLQILNIFALRATDVKEVNVLLSAHDSAYITGPDNDRHFIEALKGTDNLICAWGNANGIHAKTYDARVLEVKALIKKHYKGQCFRVTGKKPTKQPLHGLMWGFTYQLDAFPFSS